MKYLKAENLLIDASDKKKLNKFFGYELFPLEISAVVDWNYVMAFVKFIDKLPDTNDEMLEHKRRVDNAYVSWSVPLEAMYTVVMNFINWYQNF